MNIETVQWLKKRCVKDSGMGRMAILGNSDYLENYEIPHIFITFSKNRAAWHAKWRSIICAEFGTFTNK